MRCCAILERDWREPAQALAPYADEPHALALLSGAGGPRGRWSYLARQPDAVLTLGAKEGGAPLPALRALAGPPSANPEGAPPFAGGVAGLACYEFAARLEPPPLGRRPGWPDLACARYPAVLAFDHDRRRVLAVGRGATDEAAQAQAAHAARWLEAPAPAAVRGPLSRDLAAAAPASLYESAVAEVVARIGRGEIFQANIARAWTGALVPGARPYDLLAALIAASPAPFAGYLRLPGLALVSNSPERFVQVRPAGGGFEAESRPIKGTRPRGRDAAEDAALAGELAASEKDRAENLMIVDLMRNDLSRVCENVRATELFRPEAFANVHHLVSTVTGRLRPGLSGLDAFAAAFPPGSITGAPKIQAMKVIAGLEPPRGPYCGALFWAGFDGALDSSVLIRSVALEEDRDGWRFEARAGAGIVADSRPHDEALETEAKIAAIRRALEQGLS